MEQDTSPEYIKGFNQMYSLMQEMPEIADQLISAKSQSERFKGMMAGARQYELERLREAARKSRNQSREMER